MFVRGYLNNDQAYTLHPHARITSAFVDSQQLAMSN